MADADFVVVTEPTFRSGPLAVFSAMASTIEDRFGPPVERDLDSNGCGLFDATCVRFSCGLEVGLSRFHLGRALQALDPETEPSQFEILANDRDLAHVAFHLRVPLESMALWVDASGVPFVRAPSTLLVVMRTDDNGNDVEVKRVTSRCEAEAVVRAYEAHAHKQTYWIA